MPTATQAQTFRRRVKDALFDRGEYLTDIAPKLQRPDGGRGYARNTVSIAVNQYRYPRVIRAIRNYLGV
jgi:hypothetical protein